jgi:hypothetical protein
MLSIVRKSLFIASIAIFFLALLSNADVAEDKIQSLKQRYEGYNSVDKEAKNPFVEEASCHYVGVEELFGNDGLKLNNNAIGDRRY